MENNPHYFVDRSRQYLYDLIEHLLENSDAVIYLEGVAGSGRTSLLKWIQSTDESAFDKHNPVVIDDIERLGDDQWQHLSETLSEQRHFLVGLAGSYDELTRRGYFTGHTIERITIPPFTRDDADLFLRQHSPSLSALNRTRLIARCRLYPGELLQASYDTELRYSGLKKNRTKFWLILLTVLTAMSWIAIQRFKLHPNQVDNNLTGHEVTAVIRQPVNHLPDKVAGEQPPPVNARIRPVPATTPPQKPVPLNKDNSSFNGINTEMPIIHQVLSNTVETVLEPQQRPDQFDKNQLLAINAENFTLQLMLATDKRNINQLMSTYTLEDSTFLYSKSIAGQLHYCLLYGVYQHIDEAGAALLQLPKPLRELGPFRRKFADIHRDLLSNNSPDKH